MTEQEQFKKEEAMFSVAMENFGPISSGKIELKPLTILMGSNNSGKSYAASLIYSIINTQQDSIHDTIDAIFSDITYKYRSIKHKKQFIEIPKNTVSVNEGNNLIKELFTVFSSRWSDIIQITKSDCTIRVSSSISKFHVTLQNYGSSYGSEKTFFPALLKDIAKHYNKLLSIDNDTIVLHNRSFSRQFVRKIVNEIHERYDKIVPNAYYLPAGRHGLMQSYKALSSQIIRQASSGVPRNRNLLRMSRLVTDFLDDLLNHTPEKGSCHAIASRLERMLHGSIIIKHSVIPPEINYSYRGKQVPLRMTSSMVSEIAPLVLYLRYLIEPKSFLIIEEPESHLHPNNQILMAKCIIDLIRSGVYVVITTHSPYLVEQIGNYLQASGLSDETRNKLNGTENLYIKPDEIAAYLFEMEHDVSNIKTIDMSVEGGIDQRQFVDAFESISEHARTIEEYNEQS